MLTPLELIIETYRSTSQKWIILFSQVKTTQRTLSHFHTYCHYITRWRCVRFSKQRFVFEFQYVFFHLLYLKLVKMLKSLILYLYQFNRLVVNVEGLYILSQLTTYYLFIIDMTRNKFQRSEYYHIVVVSYGRSLDSRLKNA